jgi:haloalkane dehalogenase
MAANERISEQVNLPSKYIQLDGAKMHYLEAGEGRPILFLHGIPTSSYLWRNIIPHLSRLGRCIAPDLIGFGKSSRPDIEYSITDHIRFIDDFILKLGLRKITLVMHGLGSVIGLNYAMNHESNCAGLVFYEAFLRSANGNDLSLPYQEQLAELEDETEMEAAANGAVFIDKIIPQSVMRNLSASELERYREPFLADGSGKPIVQYLKELPHGDGKRKLDSIIAAYSKKLTKSRLSKLMLYSVPGFVTTIATAMWARENIPNLQIVDIGEELHLGQESYPKLIGETISAWLQGVEQHHV